MENEGNVEGNNAVREKENKSDKAKFQPGKCFVSNAGRKMQF